MQVTKRETKPTDVFISTMKGKEKELSRQQSTERSEKQNYDRHQVEEDSANFASLPIAENLLVDNGTDTLQLFNYMRGASDDSMTDGSSIARTSGGTTATTTSSLTDSSNSTRRKYELKNIATFDRDEIVMGVLLGSGGFNSVTFQLDEINLQSDDKSITRRFSRQNQVRDDKSQTRRFSKQNRARREALAYRVNQSKGNKYSVKLLELDFVDSDNDKMTRRQHLSKSVRSAMKVHTKKKLTKSHIKQFTTECKILSNFDPHPNVISLYGMEEGGSSSLTEYIEEGYFLIVDQIHDTLDHRLKSWKKSRCRRRSFFRKPMKTPIPSFLDRLKIAHQVSSALEHIHSYSIIYRDLKPENIGFDCDDRVKIFDFSSAKILRQDKLFTTETMSYTSNDAGSHDIPIPTYMAPEMLVPGRTYTLSADVYSFAILLWVLCSLEEPGDDDMTYCAYVTYVINGSTTPVLADTYKNEWPETICEMIESSWLKDPASRPTMTENCRDLQSEIFFQNTLQMQQNILLTQSP